MIDGNQPSFNLWFDPWIDLQRPNGEHERLGIHDTLAHAHEFYSVAAVSPLEVVGIHRLLAAVLQVITHPASSDDLKRLRILGSFPLEEIQKFGAVFSDRFDLFSIDRPFMQTADLSLQPSKGDNNKTVAYLAVDFPSKTTVTHYHHCQDDKQYFCPACAARGLVATSAFASSGGASFKPSINGVPPIYVLPGGINLFQCLVSSLILPAFQPGRTVSQDHPWWLHSPVIGKSEVVSEVGYLHSLTFPARRVRLHPSLRNATCTRCGEVTEWGVTSMIFEMGESRPDGAAFWRDPFAAYTQKGDKAPVPIRPNESKAIWREYAALFLKDIHRANGGIQTLRPAVLDQLDGAASVEFLQEPTALPIRCIGIRTDMKAKIFECIDTGFDVPLALLHSTTAGIDVEDAIEYCANRISNLTSILKKTLNGNKKKGNRYSQLYTALSNACWLALTEPFKAYTLSIAELQFREQDDSPNIAMRLAWHESTVKLLLHIYEQVLEEIGDSGEALRLRYTCLDNARRCLFGILKKERELYE